MSFANVGSADRLLRLVAGIVLIVFALTGMLDPSSALGITAIVVGGVLAVTALFSFCPLYAALGLRTRRDA